MCQIKSASHKGCSSLMLLGHHKKFATNNENKPRFRTQPSFTV